MSKILNFEKPEDMELDTLEKEIGADVLRLLFISNARIIAQAYSMDPNVLISDIPGTPREPRTIFWLQITAAIKSMQAVYGLSPSECNNFIADQVAELLVESLIGGGE